MSTPYFSEMLPNLSERAARATVNLLGYSDKPLRRYLTETFAKPYGADGSFIGDPAFEAVFGWKTGDRTMQELAEGVGQALLTKDLVAAMDAPPKALATEYRFAKSQKPYSHQIEAWEILRRPQAQSIVVSSGTGSGKTECFLVPILDSLAREQAAVGSPLVGVRAIFLYPLNALINSQRDRLRAWTHSFGKEVRFCLYNGNTPDQRRSTEGADFPSEVGDRRTLRSSPPPILVTNSTMLEFMLVRAQDAPIIEQSKGKLSWIVLDEAHSYIGSQAAELALMLRRVLHAFSASPDQVRFVATSATIGDPNGEAGVKLRRFLADVAGVDESQVHLVAGQREVPRLPSATSLSDDALDNLALIDGTNEVSAERFRALTNSKAARAVRELFVGDPSKPSVARLSDVTAVLRKCGISACSESTALKWLDLLSGVRDENETPFLPLRGHIFHQTLPGLWACSDRACALRASTALDDSSWPFGTVYLAIRQHCDCGAPCYQVVACDDCGAVYLEAEHSQDGRLVQPEDVSQVDEFQLDVESVSDDAETKEDHDSSARPGTAALVVNRELRGTERWSVNKDNRLICDTADAHTLVMALHEDGGDGLECPACGAAQSRRSTLFRKARISAPFLLSGILPTLLEFAPDGPNPADLPYRGRRLLTFSDSRQGTARLATRLQQDSERSRVRGLVYHHVIGFGVVTSASRRQKISDEIKALNAVISPALPDSIRDSLEEQIKGKLSELEALAAPQPIPFTDLRQRLVSEGNDFNRMLATYRQYSSNCFGSDTGPLTLAGMLIVREFGRRPKRQNSLETMGMVSVQYPALQGVSSTPGAWTRRGLTLDEWRAFLKLALDHIVRGSGCLEVPQEWRQWLGMPIPKMRLIPLDRPEVGRNQRRWPSVKRSGDRSILVRLAANLLAVNIGEASGQDAIDECLSRAWSDLIAVSLLQPTGDGHILRLESLAFSAVRQAWLCPVTRRFLDTTVQGVTPYLPLNATKDTSLCEKITIPVYGKPFGGDTSAQAHLAEARLWMQRDEQIQRLRDEGIWSDLHDRVVELSPYFAAAEHSAQQPAEVLDRYERHFKEGRLNLLSCSTTMEMGIDIGGVRLVAMNNVPPHPANYLQRAGRAGRRRELRSCAVTLCKSNPHDQAVFANSRWPFDMLLPAPVVSLNSPVIVQRHVNALILGVALRGLSAAGDNDLHKLTCGWFFADIDNSPLSRFDDFCESFDPKRDKALSEGLSSLVRNSIFAGREPRSFVIRATEMMTSIAMRWRNELKGLQVDQPGSNEPAAKAIAFQKRRLEDEYLLRELATQGFLPAHGFPTSIAAFDTLTIEDIKRLPSTPSQGRDDNRMRRRDLASRDLTTALREYAPGADVVMDGRVYRSAGITLNWHVPASQADASEVQSIRYAWRCSACGASGSSVSIAVAQQCDVCGEVHPNSPKAFLSPSGFAVDFGSRPHNDISAQGFVPIELPWVSATGEWSPLPNPGLGRFRSTERGHVYHYSAGQSRRGYALCLGCGRAEPMAADGTMPKVFQEPHSRLRGGKGTDRICTGSFNVWSIKPSLDLGHEAFTDVLEIQICDSAGRWLGDATAAQTIAVATRNALARRLGVQVAELACSYKAARVNSQTITHSILIFDKHAAGYASGADGFIAELLNSAHAALNCPKDCDSACPHCVLDFDQRFQTDRLDRHAALKWLSRDWLNALRLPEPLQYFGGASRVETIALRPAVLKLASAASTRVVRLIAHGPPSEWDLGVSAMRQLAFDLSARGTDVEILLTTGSHQQLSDENRYLLASLADHPLVSVKASPSSPIAGGAVILAEVVGLDGISRWATSDASSGIFSEKWGQSKDPVITVRQAPGSSLAMDRLVGDQIRPSTKVAGDVEVVLHREVDGPLFGFGERLWKLLATSHSGLLSILESAELSVSAISYSDRYLFSPLSVALLKQLLVGLKMRIGSDRWGRPEIEIATLDCRPGTESRAQYLVFHDWSDVRTRNAVLEASIKSLSAIPLVLTSERSTLQHGRSLVVTFANGAKVTVRFDQGVSYWRSSAIPHGRGESQLRFPFSADGARQWDSLSRLAIPIEGSAHPTEIFVKVREA